MNLSDFKKDCFGNYEISIVIFDNKEINEVNRLIIRINNDLFIDHGEHLFESKCKAYITTDEIEFLSNIEIKKVYAQYISRHKNHEVISSYSNFDNKEFFDFLNKLPHNITAQPSEKIDPKLAVEIMSNLNSLLKAKNEIEIKEFEGSLKKNSKKKDKPKQTSLTNFF